MSRFSASFCLLVMVSLGLPFIKKIVSDYLPYLKYSCTAQSYDF